MIAAPIASDQRIKRLDPPAGPGALAPNLTVTDRGVLLSWIEPVADDDDEKRMARVRFSRFADGEWSEPCTIVERDDLFVNWADLPHVQQAPNGSLLAHWLQSSGPNVYAYDVMLARSVDHGRTWDELGPAHDDGTETEHGFVSSVVDGDGVRLFWLDGRDMAGDAHDPHDPHGHGGGDMQLRTALITEKIGDSVVLDDRVCECCDTAAAMTASGPIIVYRDRTEGEVRDISIVRRFDGEWTSPRTVHDDGWGISGCPVNGPAVDAHRNNVAVAWHTGADFEPRVLVAFSDDAGATFNKPIKLDGERSMGRVDLLMREDGSAIVSWLTTDGYGGMIRAQRIEPDGTKHDAIDITRTNPGRNSGFPKIALLDENRILAVWTHVGDPFELRAAAITIVAE